MFSEDSNEAFLLFEKFMSENEKAICLDIEEINRITDIKAWEIIHDLSGASTPTEFQALVPAKRNEILSILKEHGLSIRRIVRLTGTALALCARDSAQKNRPKPLKKAQKIKLPQKVSRNALQEERKSETKRFGWQ